MKFTSVITALLCAEAALGARLTEKRRQSREARQLARRASASGALRSSQPKIPSDSVLEGITNQTNVEYSSNWAGAVLIGTGYTEVTGTVTVPTLTGSSASSTESAGSAVSYIVLLRKTKDLTDKPYFSGSVLMAIHVIRLFCKPALTGMLMAPAYPTMPGMSGKSD